MICGENNYRKPWALIEFNCIRISKFMYYLVLSRQILSKIQSFVVRLIHIWAIYHPRNEGALHIASNQSFKEVTHCAT